MRPEQSVYTVPVSLLTAGSSISMTMSCSEQPYGQRTSSPHREVKRSVKTDGTLISAHLMRQDGTLISAHLLRQDGTLISIHIL